MSQIEKVSLERELEVRDGYLSASVSEEGAYMMWRSKENDVVSESIDWRGYKGTPLATVTIPSGSDRINERAHIPNRLMAHRTRFEGVHEKLDEIMSLYDSGHVRI